MATSQFPTQVDNNTEVVDGVNVIEGEDMNLSYAAGDSVQTFVGASGKSQANNIDILNYLKDVKPTIRFTYTDATHISASAGITFGVNSGETLRAIRRNTGAVAIDTAADMDTGAIGNNLDYFIHSVFDAVASTVTFVISLSSTVPTGITTFQLLGGFTTNGSAEIIESTVWSVAGMRVINIKNFETGAVATGTTTVPDDDTIPQITEGDEYMTIEYTPKNALNKLKIDVVWIGMISSDYGLVGLFQDAIANCVAAAYIGQPFTTSVTSQPHTFSHFMAAGGVTKITFRVRVGGATAGTNTFNGRSAARRFGGVVPSSITVTEYEV